MSLPVYMDFVLGKGWTVEGAKPIGTQLESSASLVIGRVSAGLRAATLSADEAAGMLEECVDVVRLLEEQVAKLKRKLTLQPAPEAAPPEAAPPEARLTPPPGMTNQELFGHLHVPLPLSRETVEELGTFGSLGDVHKLLQKQFKEQFPVHTISESEASAALENFTNLHSER